MRVNVTGLAKLFDLSNSKSNLTRINGLNQYFVDDIIANFSSIVVVLGKNGGNSSDIVEMLSNKLENFDINTYISDINEEESYLMDEEQPEEVLYFDPDEKKYRNYVEIRLVKYQTGSRNVRLVLTLNLTFRSVASNLK